MQLFCQLIHTLFYRPSLDKQDLQYTNSIPYHSLIESIAFFILRMDLIVLFQKQITFTLYLNIWQNINTQWNTQQQRSF